MVARGGKPPVVAVAVVIALAVSGCGRKDFKNDPRPPLPAEIAVKIAKDIRTRRFRFSPEMPTARCAIFTVVIHGWPTTSKSAASTS